MMINRNTVKALPGCNIIMEQNEIMADQVHDIIGT